MLSILLLTLTIGLPDDKPKPRPAAMLLELKGKAEIHPADGPTKVAEPGDGEILDAERSGLGLLVELVWASVKDHLITLHRAEISERNIETTGHPPRVQFDSEKIAEPRGLENTGGPPR